MTKLYIISDILANDPYSGFFYVESVTYALNGVIGRYEKVAEDGDWKKLPEIIQWIAKKHGLHVNDLEIINLSKETEINVADLL